MKTKAYLLETNAGVVVYCRRDRFKHCYRIGTHGPTDAAFRQALREGTVLWPTRITSAQLRLFQNICKGLR